MKNWKRILALAGVVIVVLVALLPVVFAFGTGEEAQGWFRGAILAAFWLPVILYAILLWYKYLNKNKRVDERENRKIDTIIFDMGNVLVDFNWRTYLDGFHFPEKEKKALEKAVFQNPAWQERDKGVEDEVILQKFIEGAPEYEEDIRAVFARTEETISPMDYAETWVKYLKSQGYRLYVLSNYSSTMLEKTKHMMPLKYMDGTVFSCEVKAIKPEPEIYQILLDTYGIKPESAVFLDDREENLVTARKFGIHTIVFQNFKQAAGELEKLGVK